MGSCATCRLQSFECPGHFGHIELPAPVFHPLFMNNMYNLLRATCMFCHRFKMSREVVRAPRYSVFSADLLQLCKYAAKLRLLEYGLLQAAQDLDDLHRRVRRGDEDAADDSAGADEPVKEFRVRVGLFVAMHLHRATTSKRDDYKMGLCYEARKNLITDFLKAVMRNTCQNEDCGA